MFTNIVALVLSASVRLHSGHCVGQDLDNVRTQSIERWVSPDNGSVWALSHTPNKGPVVYCLVELKGKN